MFSICNKRKSLPEKKQKKNFVSEKKSFIGSASGCISILFWECDFGIIFEHHPYF